MNTIPIPVAPPGISTDPFTRAAQIAGAVRLTDVKPTPTKWLWPGKIALGRVTLLASDPGFGKSLVTLDIAARISTGATWPDAAKAERGGRKAEDPASGLPQSPLRLPPSSVLLLTSEDDLADTVRPRLEALGADCNKILAISHVPGENPNDVPRAFALNRDLARLRNLLGAIPDCRLLIIDPISAFLDGTNEHGNADVRTLLTALTTIAREREVAVLVVSHLRKKEGAAIHRTMGSLAFIATARAAWVICKDPEDPHKRLFLPLKNNLAPTACGLAFAIEPNVTSGTPTVRWSPDPVETTPDCVIALGRTGGRPDDERQYAIDWLRERLSNGPKPAIDIRNEADMHGITYGTLRRAFRHLKAEAVRHGILPFATWHWRLPGLDAQNPGGEFCAPSEFPDDLNEIFNYWRSQISGGACSAPSPKSDDDSPIQTTPDT